MTPRITKILLALIVVYGAALRLEAITANYGPVTSPGWLRWVQERTALVMPATHPSAVRWDRAPTYPHRDGTRTQYYSDPYNYLQFGRQMQSFSAAHYREPLFPFATKVSLWFLRDQDVAVSFASAAFSVLLIIATYLLGAYAFSAAVGLAAALGVAIEYDIVSWDVGGWRDEAFAFAVLMVAYAAIRQRRSPARASSLLLGAAAGIAGLLRITSLTFLAPVFVYLLWTNRRRKGVRQLGLAVLTFALFVGPYMVNCWRVYGDPFYAIAPATHDYLALAGSDEPNERAPGAVFQPPALAADLGTTNVTSSVPVLGPAVWNRPFQTFETLALGLTSYPFTNKWIGFDRWWPGLGGWLAWLALAGLLCLAGSWEGRVLLLILVTATIPFAVTWRLTADWRFTEHAYPFFLIAAAYVVSLAAPWLRPSRLRELAGQVPRGPGRRAVIFWASVLSGAALVSASIVYLLPVLIVRESLKLSEEATIQAGPRDAAFFSGGWSGPAAAGNVTFRTFRAAPSSVRVPLPRVEDYDLTLRLDPAPRPTERSPADLPTVHVSVNDRAISDIKLTWDPERVGAYTVKLPADAVTTGFNRLTLRPDSPDRTFALWYVRVRPSSMKPGPSPVMGLDAPARGAHITSGDAFAVVGWALDRSATAGTGVDAVHVYAFPFGADQNTDGQFLGAADLKQARPDVAQVYGRPQFDTAGFVLRAPGLATGQYHIVAYARSAGLPRFNQSQVADVTVSPPTRPEMALDGPVAGSQAPPITVAGWALDLAATSGTGIDGVRVSAVPVRGAGPGFAGTAAYGVPRPDVGKVFGARFTNSGYSLVIGALPAGEYELRVEPHSTISPVANQSRTVRITIK